MRSGLFAKSTDTRHLLKLINLLNFGNTSWRDDNANYPIPPAKSNVFVTYYYGTGSAPRHVYWAPPDTRTGRISGLTFSKGPAGNGNYLGFTVPSLAYWDIYMTA